MRNAAISRLEAVIGTWELVMTGSWFLDSLEERVDGWAGFEWLDESFIVFRWALGTTPATVLVIGYSDAQDQYHALYHDDRGVARVFDMEFDGDRWSMLREDPDFHQRFSAEIVGDRIDAMWEASDDQGVTWRKDFDLIFTRADDGP